jgi:MFS superfamily sulfate permease-like transporter
MNTTSLETHPPTRIQRIGKWIPGLNALRHYQRAWLPQDLVAGLVLCALLVPQAFNYKTAL